MNGPDIKYHIQYTQYSIKTSKTAIFVDSVVFFIQKFILTN